MPGQRGGGGVEESMRAGMTGILSSLGGLMAAPDADPQFLQSLMSTITAYLQHQNQAMAGQQAAAPGGPGASGGPGAAGGGPAGLGGGAGGANPLAALLGGAGGASGAPGQSPGGGPQTPSASPNSFGPGGASGGGNVGLVSPMTDADELRRLMGSTTGA